LPFRSSGVGARERSLDGGGLEFFQPVCEVVVGFQLVEQLVRAVGCADLDVEVREVAWDVGEIMML
jgi:hypothetical protein